MVKWEIDGSKTMPMPLAAAQEIFANSGLSRCKAGNAVICTVRSWLRSIDSPPARVQKSFKNQREFAMGSIYSWKPRSWIVPPELKDPLVRFEIRCDSIIEKNKQGKYITLLICGATGVGKSMFTELFIHKYRKYRQDSKVLVINCSAIPETLLESELFGYEKGAHSLARKQKRGLFEIVEDGVIVLEELGEINKELQAKLLIAIENRTFIRVGGTTQISLQAQIIATTNVDKDTFRKDFWYRLETFTVPSLYERRYDILYYINYFDPELMGLLTGGVLLALFSYNWPGNVREVEMMCNSIRENIQYAKKNKFLRKNNFEFVVQSFQNQQFGAFFRHNQDVSTFQFDKALELARKMITKNIKVAGIEKLLNKYMLSFNCYNQKFKLGNLKYQNEAEEYTLSYTDDKIAIHQNKFFANIYGGFLIFCYIFIQNSTSNKDILDLDSPFKYSDFEDEDNNIDKILAKELNDKNLIPKKGAEIPDNINFINFINIIKMKLPSPLNNFHYLDEPMQPIIIECLKYLTGISTITNDDMKNIQNLFSRNRNNKFLAAYFEEETLGNDEEVPIVNISIDDLRPLYYETVANATGLRVGKQKKIAEISGRDESTISQELKKYGLNEKFANPNFTPRKRLVILK